jgi:hypothetical protein
LDEQRIHVQCLEKKDEAWNKLRVLSLTLVILELVIKSTLLILSPICQDFLGLLAL